MMLSLRPNYWADWGTHPSQIPPHRNLIMPSVVFAFGDSSKEVDLKDINSVEVVASNMKEVIKKEKESKKDSK